MKSQNIDYRKHDQQVWEEELDEFVPSRIFDAHIHLFARDLLSPAERDKSTFMDSDFDLIQEWASKLYPGREVHYLVLGFPKLGTDVEAHNRMISQQVSIDPISRMNCLVTPSNSPQQIKQAVNELGFIGLKPYRIYSVTGESIQCRIRDFLPESQLEVANDLGLWVTMHLSRFHGCADDMNLQDLEDYTTKRYPRIKWILAHCARSFTYWPIRQAIERLRHLPNIWYDLSAVCDVRPFITLFQKENKKRIFFGSDGVDSTFFHGTYLVLGRSWGTYFADKVKPMNYLHCDGRPILAIYEQLLAIKHAAEIVGLSAEDIEDIFWRNAAREFDLDWPEK